MSGRIGAGFAQEVQMYTGLLVRRFQNSHQCISILYIRRQIFLILKGRVKGKFGKSYDGYM